MLPSPRLPYMHLRWVDREFENKGQVNIRLEAQQTTRHLQSINWSTSIIWSSQFKTQGGPQKGHNVLYALTLTNINQFSKPFYCQNRQTICNNIITKHPTTPKVCCYSTLWNVTESGKLSQRFTWSRHWSVTSPAWMRRPAAMWTLWTFDLRTAGCVSYFRQ